jgi:hypothetical protein
MKETLAMKNLSKRTKTLLAIIGAVIVIVVIALVIIQPSVDDLFGTGIATVSITPANPTITYPGMQVQLTANYSSCTWSISDSKVLVIRSSTGHTATVEGAGPGKATVNVQCEVKVTGGTRTLPGITTVTVGSYPFGQ